MEMRLNLINFDKRLYLFFIYKKIKQKKVKRKVMQISNNQIDWMKQINLSYPPHVHILSHTLP